MKYYIAYGSNLNKEQMHWRCHDAKPVGTGWLKNHRLVFQGNPYGAHANVIPDKHHEVPVAVWKISSIDEIMLDRYEGVAGGYYTKETAEVTMDNGKKLRGLIYIMTPHDYGMPAEHYTDVIKQGYVDFNLGIKPLNEALIDAAEHVGY